MVSRTAEEGEGPRWADRFRLDSDVKSLSPFAASWTGATGTDHGLRPIEIRAGLQQSVEVEHDTSWRHWVWSAGESTRRCSGRLSAEEGMWSAAGLDVGRRYGKPTKRFGRRTMSSTERWLPRAHRTRNQQRQRSSKSPALALKLHLLGLRAPNPRRSPRLRRYVPWDSCSKRVAHPARSASVRSRRPAWEEKVDRTSSKNGRRN